jgi:hypothetical protein
VIARRGGEDPRQIEFRPGRLPQINLVGFVPWVVGGTVGVVLLAGETAFANTWALPIDAGIALVLFLIARTLARPSWETMSRPHDPRSEVDDPWNARIRCGACGHLYLAAEIDRDPSEGQRPVCAVCATTSTRLYHAAHLEARAHRASANGA